MTDDDLDGEEWKREADMFVIGKEAAAKVAKAWQDERSRCVDLVRKEIKTGLHAGLTDLAPSIRILRRLLERITDGHFA